MLNSVPFDKLANLSGQVALARPFWMRFRKNWYHKGPSTLPKSQNALVNFFVYMQRYLKLRKYGDRAILEPYKQKFTFKQQRTYKALRSAEVHTINQCVDALSLMETGISLMGSCKTPTTHVKDVMQARIVHFALTLNLPYRTKHLAMNSQIL